MTIVVVMIAMIMLITSMIVVVTIMFMSTMPLLIMLTMTIAPTLTSSFAAIVLALWSAGRGRAQPRDPSVELLHRQVKNRLLCLV